MNALSVWHHKITLNIDSKGIRDSLSLQRRILRARSVSIPGSPVRSDLALSVSTKLSCQDRSSNHRHRVIIYGFKCPMTIAQVYALRILAQELYIAIYVNFLFDLLVSIIFIVGSIATSHHDGETVQPVSPGQVNNALGSLSSALLQNSSLRGASAGAAEYFGFHLPATGSKRQRG